MTTAAAVPNQEPSNEAAESGLFHESPEVTPEIGEESGHEAPQVETPSGDEAEEVELTTLDQLAEYVKQVDPDIALDSDALMKLSVTKKVNGQTSEITIAEAIAKAQMIEAADTYLSDAKKKAHSIVEQATQEGQSWQRDAQSLRTIFKELEDEIEQDEKRIDWDKLRTDDPAMYAAKEAELRRRKEKLDKRKKRAEEHITGVSEREQQKHLDSIKQYVAAEREKLVEVIPDFGDEDKRPELTEKITKDLTSRGFSEQEIKQVIDHRYVALAHDAMLYREASKKKEAAAKKRVIRVPKVTTPGSREGNRPNGEASTDGWGILFKNV